MKIGAALLGTAALLAAAGSEHTALFRNYCVSCHGGKTPAAGVDLVKLITQSSLGESYQQWEKIAAVLEDKRMPPAKLPQPADASRRAAAAWVKTSLDAEARRLAGDPGRVTVRRLTSGEYAYTIRDLTGLDLKFEGGFVSDSVGGEGFTNFGDVQFMQDASLERYLEAAKKVAAHAVIGAGPLSFFADPGKSGLELSAVHRIQQINYANGFRASSAEGGKPYGLERYAKAFHAAWRYKHRAALGEPAVTLDGLAKREGISGRFARHVWSVLNAPKLTYPTSEIAARWRKLPAPGVKSEAAVREQCGEIQKYIVDWTRSLFGAGGAAEGGQGDERSLALTDESVQAVGMHRYRFFSRSRGGQPANVYLSVASMNPESSETPYVIWRNAFVRFRKADRSALPQKPLREAMTPAAAAKLNFGRLPDGSPLENPNDFVMQGGSLALEMTAPEGAGAIEFTVEAHVGPSKSGTAVLRCTVSDRAELAAGRPVSALLGYPKSEGFQTWKKGVLEFARDLPHTSHGEPTPADRDPIPLPFNTAYNQPERDHYHVKLKYYRDDQFLMAKILDDAARVRVEQAWADLYGSFEYHDEFLRFVDGKYKLGLKERGIADLSMAEIDAMPEEPRKYVKALKTEHDGVVKAQWSARPGHVEDCLKFAANAWRRPLTPAEKDGLRSFYTNMREEAKLDHDKAVRAVLTRILVSPAFLYRFEQPGVSSARPLTNHELASRLSYFLWSSAPDAELTRAAGAGELANQALLDKQVKRMLADPRARRLAVEFFGQWLGFYRFDEYSGVDPGRFPEFTAEVKTAMYDEAVSFFEHIVRQDKPVRDIFFADYTFLNQALAKHYGIKRDGLSAKEPKLVAGAGELHRGGLLTLGAVLTTTSAPLRTSPVKRGDWILRRVLGTPTPPPPADAGSIPADDKLFAGQTLRQRLESHKRNPTCAACHLRIDPLGFPLERYDPVGRWRESYHDGKAVEDSATLSTGQTIDGVTGLTAYLKANEPQLLRTMSQKLLGFALGRTVQLSDQPLVRRMTQQGGTASFSKLITEIVASKQFRYRRENDSGPTGAVQSASVRNSNQDVKERE